MRCARSAPSRSRTCRSRPDGFCRRWDGSANRRGFDLWQSVRSASKPSRKSNERIRHMNIKVGKQAIAEATQKLKNWGRWGKDDQIGTQTGLFGGRFNPIHQMLATGTDAIAGRQDWNKIRYADDTLNLCVQGAT